MSVTATIKGAPAQSDWRGRAKVQGIRVQFVGAIYQSAPPKTCSRRKTLLSTRRRQNRDLALGLSSALAVVLSGGGLRPCWGGPKLFGKTKIGKLIFPQISTIHQEN